MFHDVDVNTQIEVELAGQKIVQSLIVRAADRKSVEEICDEIRQGRRGDPSTERRYSGTIAAVSLPRPVRSLAWRAVMSNPFWFTRCGGTIGLSSIGMFGPGGGWGHPDCTANADDHHRRHHHQTSISERQLGAPGDARSHNLDRSRHRRRRPCRPICPTTRRASGTDRRPLDGRRDAQEWLVSHGPGELTPPFPGAVEFSLQQRTFNIVHIKLSARAIESYPWRCATFAAPFAAEPGR